MVYSKRYEKLFQYAAVIHQADPGAIYKVLYDAFIVLEKCLFQRFFVACLDQINVLFLNSCRPFIGTNECRLKRKFGGVLLADIASNASKRIVPLALSMCKIENTEM